MRISRYLAAALWLIVSSVVIAADQAATDPVADGSAERSVVEALDGSTARFQWDPISRVGTFWIGGHSMTVTAGEPLALVDFAQVMLIDPPQYRQDMLYLSEKAFADVAGFLQQHEPPRRTRTVSAIVIDPGHGGRDGGGYRDLPDGEGTIAVREKDIVLDISLKVRDRLRQLLADTQLSLTREDDTYPELEDRVRFAHQQREEPLDNVLFVSIHANSSVAEWTDARGVEIYYLSPDEERDVLEARIREELDPEVAYILNDLKEDEYTLESKLMAQFILDAIAEQLPDTPIERGVRENRFYVNRVARMPSILIETGFVNNKQEARLLTTESYRRRMAIAIADGIAAYVRDFEQQ